MRLLGDRTVSEALLIERSAFSCSTVVVGGGGGSGRPSVLATGVISTLFPGSHLYPSTLTYSPEAH